MKYLLILMIFFPDGHFERKTQIVTATSIEECLTIGNKLGKTYPGDFQLICQKQE